MRFASLVFTILLAGCGGTGGGSASNPPPPPPALPEPLALSVHGQAIVKVRAAEAGTTVMEERLLPYPHAGGPDRSLEIFDAHGARTGTYAAPAGFSLIDFAQHAGGDVTVALATATAVRLVRVSRTGAALDTLEVIDPQAALDRFYDAGGIHDDQSLLPVFTRDAIALAPIGEGIALALRTGRNATVAYRYEYAGGTGFTRAWRTLVEPGLSAFAIGITSGSFDTFTALENHLHVALDADDAGHIAVAVPSKAFSASVFAAHADFFSEPTTAQDGVLVTRLSAAGARLGTTVVDTERPSELHGVRLAGDDVALVGRVFTQRRDDGSGWDAWAAHVSLASGALSAFRAVDVDRGDILFDIASLGDGRYIAVGATRYTQNPDGASVSESAALLAVVLDAGNAVRARIPLAVGLRNNQVRSVAPVGSRWIVAGQLDGPGTHSGDGAPAVITADGFVQALAIPPP
jgi:hypothetical protein